MHDQFVKMKDSGGKVCILKGDRVAAEEEEVLSFDLPVDMETTSYDLIFPHPEVLVENTNILKVIKSPAFKTKWKWLLSMTPILWMAGRPLLCFLNLFVI